MTFFLNFAAIFNQDLVSPKLALMFHREGTWIVFNIFQRQEPSRTPSVVVDVYKSAQNSKSWSPLTDFSYMMRNIQCLFNVSHIRRIIIQTKWCWLDVTVILHENYMWNGEEIKSSAWSWIELKYISPSIVAELTDLFCIYCMYDVTHLDDGAWLIYGTHRHCKLL